MVLVLALGGLTSVAIANVRKSFPETSGRLMVSGLKGQVEVLRDSYGVPHIYADNPEDLFAAQGYVHAQDRFFEMDFRRHLAAGRLSELFGASQLETDPYVRTLGWRRVARAGAGAARTLDSPLSRRVRRWRQYLSCRPNSRRPLVGVFPAQAARRAVHPSGMDSSRFCGLAQSHGLGPGVQPHPGD